jgi:hypothetical protein
MELNDMMDMSILMECSRINEEITTGCEELDSLCVKADTVKGFLEEIPKFGTSSERLKEIHAHFTDNNMEIGLSLNKQAFLANATIAYEEKLHNTIMMAIKKILEKLKELIKNIIRMNLILANKLKTETRYGVIANLRKYPANTFKGAIVPFYKKATLNPALQTMKGIDFNKMGSNDQLQNALQPLQVKTFDTLGWVINGNVISKAPRKELSTTMVELGWAMDDLNRLANDTIGLLTTPFIDGRSVIKKLEVEAKSVKGTDEAIKLRNKIKNIKRTTNLLQDVSTSIAWSIILIINKLKADYKGV